MANNSLFPIYHNLKKLIDERDIPDVTKAELQEMLDSLLGEVSNAITNAKTSINSGISAVNSGVGSINGSLGSLSGTINRTYSLANNVYGHTSAMYDSFPSMLTNLKNIGKRLHLASITGGEEWVSNTNGTGSGLIIITPWENCVDAIGGLDGRPVIFGAGRTEVDFTSYYWKKGFLKSRYLDPLKKSALDTHIDGVEFKATLTYDTVHQGGDIQNTERPIDVPVNNPLVLPYKENFCLYTWLCNVFVFKE